MCPRVQSSAVSTTARNIFQQRANSWGPFMVVYGTGQVRALLELLGMRPGIWGTLAAWHSPEHDLHHIYRVRRCCMSRRCQYDCLQGEPDACRPCTELPKVQHVTAHLSVRCMRPVFSIPICMRCLPKYLEL